MKTHSARIRRMLQSLRTRAYERELSHSLDELASQFTAWKRDAITTSELRDEVQHFTNGPARDLANFYNRAPLDLAVAHAVVRGILDKNDVPEEILDLLGNVINLCRATGV